MCSSPLTMIAHCAAVTRKIRLGTGIVVAPLYTPARLIADVAMVDQLSNGRLNLGIGSGYQHFESSPLQWVDPMFLHVDTRTLCN